MDDKKASRTQSSHNFQHCNLMYETVMQGINHEQFPLRKNLKNIDFVKIPSLC